MSTSLLAERSEWVLVQKQALNQRQFPLLPRFPLEITRKILCSVLISDERLSFTRLPLSAKESAARPKPRNNRNWQAQFSDVLRLCLWHRCENNEPEAPALHHDFGALCLASQQFRQEARDIFFSKNKWVLHCTSSFNAIEWVLRYWGPMALSSMTDLRIEISVMKYHLVGYYQCLEKFSDAVKDRHSLQELSIQWIQGARPLQTARPVNWSPHVVSIDRERGLERNSKGKRGRKDWEEWECKSWRGPQSEPKSWAATEVVLQPLTVLRGVREVRIEGTVTDAYAKYLEMALSALVSVEIPDFERLQRAKEGLERLKKGIEVKY